MLFVLASLMRLNQMIRLELEFPRGRKAGLTGAMQEDVPFFESSLVGKPEYLLGLRSAYSLRCLSKPVWLTGSCRTLVFC